MCGIENIPIQKQMPFVIFRAGRQVQSDGPVFCQGAGEDVSESPRDCEWSEHWRAQATTHCLTKQ